MKNIPPLLVLAVHPPSKIEEQFQKDPLQKAHVSRKSGVFLPTSPPIDLKKTPSRPGVHRRVHIPKRPLVGGDLAIGMHTPDAGEEQELRLRKLRVEVGKGHTVEGEIPSREPRILPLIRHRNDRCDIKMPPVMVSSTLPFWWRRRLGGIAVEPTLDVEMIKLLAPDHPRVGLTLNAPRVGIRMGLEVVIKSIGFASPFIEEVIKIPKG